MEVPRERQLRLLNAAKGKTDLVKVITGMRRTGKSTLLKQFRNTLDGEDDVVFLDLDLLDEEMDWKDLKELIHERLSDGDVHYIFIDEIQEAEGWERVVAEMVARRDCDVYITGSSSKMLSSELATKISGRYVEIEVQPLSFKEYLTFSPGDTYERFDEFLRYGSLPVIEPVRGAELCERQLEDVFNTVLVKDVLAHTGSKDVSKVVSIARYLYTNIGNNTNVDNISNDLGIGYPTVQRFVDGMVSAHLFEYCERYDIVGRKILRSKGKYYVTDIGMRRVLMRGAGTPDISRPLENIVYMELRRRYPVVRIGSYRDYEVDFTASDGDVTEYYQVTQTLMSEDTREREFRPYGKIADNHRKKVLTLDRLGLGSYDGIEVINIVDWLLGR
ncbi:MAG: ATP-binding protein [archaeon]|nr:ATP-binding protein [archaeon]